MHPGEREALRRRFRFRCGYCSVSESDAGSELTIDHFQPRSQGGTHGPENWVYSCHACNEFKGDWWQPESRARLLHPERDDIVAHLAEGEDGLLHPLTESGAFHITRLRLNRPQLVTFRLQKNRREAASAYQERLLERLRILEQKVKTLTTQLENFDRAD
jgi:hypothetical protein